MAVLQNNLYVTEQKLQQLLTALVTIFFKACKGKYGKFTFQSDVRW